MQKALRLLLYWSIMGSLRGLPQVEMGVGRETRAVHRLGRPGLGCQAGRSDLVQPKKPDSSSRWNGPVSLGTGVEDEWQGGVGKR